MLKVPALYLGKQKSFTPKKIFLSRCQYQNKKALFTDPIFSEGFGLYYCNYVYEHVILHAFGLLSEAHTLLWSNSCVVNTL